MEPYEELEKRFGEWSGCNNPNTVAVASGTAALHVALEALDLPQGSEIIIPDFTMVACARAAIMAGLRPVFVDCGNDLNLDPLLLKDALSHKTSAVMAVHIYGRQCKMVNIHVFAQYHGLKVIEDMAEIHGVAPHPNTDAACWSFYKNKIIAGEEGGMIAFKSQHAEDRARQLRSLGFTPEHDFNHIPRGVNARMSNAHAKLILGSLYNVSENLVRRWQIEYVYIEYVPNEWRMPARNKVWVYDVLCPRGTDTAKLVKHLNEKGVAARLAFKPMHTQTEFKGKYPMISVDSKNTFHGMPNSWDIGSRVIYLPVHPRMTNDQVKYNAETLVAALSPDQLS